MKDREVLADSGRGEGDCETEMERLGVKKRMRCDLPWVDFLSSTGQQGRGAGCYQTVQMVGSIGWDQRLGENPLTKLLLSRYMTGINSTVLSYFPRKRSLHLARGHPGVHHLSPNVCWDLHSPEG
ncbi:unnamed protein product [Pleuronectes platessa]|uniref:Uncharacterized protein n=1 Tax=Pleuronectes platessa TaxID=8262 RepID=A0A9N7Y906_PLEPL|nr:unnamed protein product [Pleuronectes platessa]